jgi:hypothetical protein
MDFVIEDIRIIPVADSPLEEGVVTTFRNDDTEIRTWVTLSGNAELSSLVIDLVQYLKEDARKRAWPSQESE